MGVNDIVSYYDFDLKGHLKNMASTLIDMSENISDFDNKFTSELEIKFTLKYEEPVIFEVKTKKHTKEVK